MKREKCLKKMYGLAVDLTKCYSREKENAIWDMAYDYNRNHYDDREIFVCEKYDDDTDELVGICIEDDYFIFAE